MLLAHLILIISHYPRTHKHGPNCTVETQERDCGVELVCLPPQDSTTYHFCGECTTHEQCTARPELMCRVEFNGRRLCVHKDMWPPDGRDWWGFALAFLACAISAGAGIGGGGLLVPLFIVALAFTPHESTPLANVTILGGAVANFAFNVRRQHPSHPRPLIAYEVALMMEPMTIAGALVGCLLNKVCPGWLITLLLVLLLGMTTWRTLQKGLRGWRRESLEQKASRRGASLTEELLPTPVVARRSLAQIASVGSGATAAEMESAARAARPPAASYFPPTPEAAKRSGSSSQLARSGSGAQLAALLPAENLNASASGSQLSAMLPYAPGSVAETPPLGRELDANATLAEVEAQAALLASEQVRWPRLDASLLVLVLGLCALISVLRGRDASTSVLRVTCGSGGYWGLLALQFGAVVLASGGIRYLLLWRHSHRQWMRAEARADVQWTPRSTALYPLVCALAGLTAGMFGIGGGIIKGPLMLEMGIKPAVASATCAFMILFTAATATMQYALFGALRPHYAAALFGVGLCGTVVGQLVVQAAIRRLKKESIITLLIAAVIGGSTLLMGANGVVEVIHSIRAGESQGFRPLCEEESPS